MTVDLCRDTSSDAWLDRWGGVPAGPSVDQVGDGVDAAV